MLWLGHQRGNVRAICWQGLSGLLMIAGLTGLALLLHKVPFGVDDVPHDTLGMVTLSGMAALYACLTVLQLRPQSLRTWRRWSYAGFYIDEVYTRLALQLWPTRWTPAASHTDTPVASALAANARK
jgi:NAD(P)H-quinone oxidoreductase subunit 5